MTEEKMTVHRALAELKIIDARIEKAIIDTTFCVANKHSNSKIQGVSIKEFEQKIHGDYNKAIDLIRRRNAIKRAVVLSNAVTNVEIGGEKYTVAEAIEMKNHGIVFKETLLEQLEQQYNQTQAELLEKNGAELEKRAEQYIIGMYGNKELATVKNEEAEKAMKEYIVNNTYDFIDPLKVTEKIDKLEKEISDFKANVDAALSTSNAITEITVAY